MIPAGLRGDRPAGQRGGTGAEQDPLGGPEQLLAQVAQGHAGRHRRGARFSVWAHAHYEWAHAHSTGGSSASGGGRVLRSRRRSATTEPGRAIRTRWSPGSRPPARARTCSTSGCGSGIAARQFQAAGCRVLGVDTDGAWPTRRGAPASPVEVATFETWDAAGRTFDTVTAAQAWHWIDPRPAAGQITSGSVSSPSHRPVRCGRRRRAAAPSGPAPAARTAPGSPG